MGLLLWLPDITLNKALPVHDWLDYVDKREATTLDKPRTDWSICKLEAGLGLSNIMPVKPSKCNMSGFLLF